MGGVFVFVVWDFVFGRFGKWDLCLEDNEIYC